MKTIIRNLKRVWKLARIIKSSVSLVVFGHQGIVYLHELYMGYVYHVSPIPLTIDPTFLTVLIFLIVLWRWNRLNAG